MCPGRRPTTGSRQKYSAAKTEVASESLPVAPFAHPASPLVPSHSYTSWTPSRAGGTQASITKLEVVSSNLEYKRQCCVVVQTSLRDRDLRDLISVITKKSLPRISTLRGKTFQIGMFIINDIPK